MKPPTPRPVGRVAVNGVDFSYMSAGPEDGPLALCLHGFPDTASTWRYLLPALSDAGYHAIAPFMRGYAPTTIAPNGRYDIAVLADDANGLHAALAGDSRAVVIGHDWGAAAALTASAATPQHWQRVVAMSWPPTGPTPVDVASYEQMRRSWYVFFLRHPGAEAVIRYSHPDLIDRLWADWSPTFDAANDAARAHAALAAEDNLTAALGYYRALPDLDAAGEPLVGGPQPTLYIHGAQDGCIGVELTADIENHMAAGSKVVRLAGVGHFPQLEAHERVNRLIIDFLHTDR